jgi:hypothetical protein
VSDARSSQRVLLVGAVALVASIVATAVLLVVAQRRYDDAVQGLARAPVGCDTTLEFTSLGTFEVFIETRGTLEELAGGCEAPSTYLRTTERPPRVQLLMVGPSGDGIDFERTSPSTYEADGFAGTAHRRVRVTETGNHVIRVTSPDSDFVVAVGRHPDDAAYPAEQGAIAVGILGGLVAVTLLVWGVIAGRASREDETGPTGPGGSPGHQPEPWDGPWSPSTPPLGPPRLPPPSGVPDAPPTVPPYRPLPPPR